MDGSPARPEGCAESTDPSRMPKTGLPRSHCGVVGPARQWEQKSYPEQGGPPHPDSFEAGDLKTAFDGAQTLGSPLMRMLQRSRKFELACLVEQAEFELQSGLRLALPRTVGIKRSLEQAQGYTAPDSGC
jgi:hypothetical protein